MTRSHRETERIRFPRCATELAIASVIALWHIAGVLKELRGEK